MLGLHALGDSRVAAIPLPTAVKHRWRDYFGRWGSLCVWGVKHVFIFFYGIPGERTKISSRSKNDFFFIL